MAIAFQCPHCQKAYKVKDELAGKKAACTQCKKVMQVPTATAVPASEEDSQALEALATAALTADEKALTSSNGSAKHVPLGAPIPFECSFCFEQVTFAASQAGKKAPCPSCRRIVTVPTPKTEKPKDWRDVDNRPSFARIETGPAPEGAWGNTLGLAGIVSREALLDAEVIVDRKSLARPDRTWLYTTLGGVALVLLVGGWWFRGKQAADDRRTGLIADAVKAAEPNANPPLPSGWAAAVHCAAGEFHLRESDTDSLKSAVKHYQAARAAARQIETPADRAALLTDVALGQADLVGDDAKVLAKRALPWDESQRELRQTLQAFKDLPQEYGWQVIESLTRKLGSVGDKQPLIVSLAPTALPDDADRATALAIVALELSAKNDPAAEAIFEEAKQTRTAEIPASARYVALLVARKQIAAARQLVGEPGGEPSLVYRLGFVDGYARSGDAADLESARKLALAGGAVEHRTAALAMLADAAAGRGAAGNEDLELAVKFTAEQAQKFTLPGWALERLSRACRRAGRADLTRQLADAIKQPGVKPWLELEALRAEMVGGKSFTPAAIDQLGDKTAAQGFAWLELGRAHAKAGADARAAIAAWPSGPSRFPGYAGAALGLQDRVRK